MVLIAIKEKLIKTVYKRASSFALKKARSKATCFIYNDNEERFAPDHEANQAQVTI